MTKTAPLDIPNLGFRVVYADPPWLFDLHSEKGEEKSPQARYDCMPTPEIVALWRWLGLDFKCRPDCALFLWGTWPMLARGDVHDVIRGWGFRGVSGFPWVKTDRRAAPVQGPGYVFRSVSEPIFLCKTGAPKSAGAQFGLLFDEDGPLDIASFGRRREHSRKPDDMIGFIEAMYPEGPYLELFARTARPGWTCWGNEVDKFEYGAAGGGSSALGARSAAARAEGLKA